MQELAFEQVGIVVGGSGSDSGGNDSVETDTIKVKVDATGSSFDRSNHWTSNNNNLFSTVVRNAGIGAIGGALGGPWGAAAGAAVGAMVGASQYYGNK